MHPLDRLSPAERHRLPAVGPRGAMLGLHVVPRVVLADVWDHGRAGVWMPEGHVVVRVWGGEGPAVWREATRLAQDLRISVIVSPPSRWALARAWWRRIRWKIARWAT